MAQLSRAVILFLGILLCFSFDIAVGQESDGENFVKFDSLARFVLETFNEKPDSVYQYKSAQVLTGLAQNDSESASYYMKLDFAVACNSDIVSQEECFPKHLICKVVVTEDPDNGEWKLQNEATNCNLPEVEEEQSPEPEEPPTPGTMEKQEEDMKAMFDDLGPFLMKHLNPLSESVGTTSDVDLEHPVDEVVAVKKHVHCVGCMTDINVDLPDLQDFVQLALTRIDETTNTQYKHNLVRIAKAQKQVVAGVRIVLTLAVGETSCLKSSVRDRDDCELSAAEPKTCVVEFLDKPWLGMREVITSTCAEDQNDLENEIVPQRFDSDVMDYLDGMSSEDNTEVVRERREVGGLRDITSSEKRLVYELAELGVRTLDEIDADDTKRIVLDVLDAKKQLADGVLYHLKLRVGTTSCDENGSTTPGCLKDQVASPKICTIQLHRSFAADSPNDIKVVKSECTNEVHHRRTSRQLGGYTNADPNDSYTQELIQFATAELDKTSGSDFRHNVVRVVSAKRQVVSGINLKVVLELSESSCRKNDAPSCQNSGSKPVTRRCTVVVYDQAWTKTRRVTSSTCEDVPTRTKRQTLVGGYGPADVNERFIKEIIAFAVAQLDESSNSQYKQNLVRVTKAESQTVAGTNVRLTLELADSTCKKNGQTCQATPGNTVKRICTVVVFDQPWTKTRRITETDCHDVAACGSAGSSNCRRKRQIVGAASEIDVKDASIQPLAHLSLAHIEAQSNALYSQKIVKILSATKQVVAGVKYTITMMVGYTSCRKPSSVDLCEVSEHSNNQVCTSEVWSRPWLNETRVTRVSCTPASRTKRSTRIGGGSHDIHYGLFREFAAKHGKSYATKEEEKRRFHIFRANMKKVETLQKTEQGTGKYGATRFADLTSKEFKKYHLGLNPALKSADSPPLFPAAIPQITLPTEFDWRHYNIVTPVKNQGMCGSCWAFSVTGNVEGQWALRHQELLSLSEQELVDCDKLDDGCKGGLPDNAYRALVSIGGLETETDYPYDGADETCHFNKTEVRVSVTGGLNITTNETQMAQWLVKNGPISIGINANAMQFYMGGVSHPWKFLCSPDSLDHGVLIVGYGVHTSSIRHKILPYWIVKNSWGPSWGEKGYYRVYRGDGTCGVNQMATSAIVG